VGGPGAGHKAWCKAKPGVQGTHWEIKKISEQKGKGVIALVPFEADERIMVDRLFSTDEFFDPSFRLRNKAMLLAGGPTMEEKYKVNSIGSVDDRGAFGGVCISLSRVNHNCDPSAAVYYDTETRAMALLATRPVAVGEEITISYTEFLNPRCTGVKSEYESHAAILCQQYGIRCPDGCACKNPVYLERVQKSNELEKELQTALSEAETIEEIEKAISEKGLQWVVYHNTFPACVRFGVRLTMYNTAKQFGIELKGLRIHEHVCRLTYPGSREAEANRGV
jgi:hypothetical protein